MTLDAIASKPEARPLPIPAILYSMGEGLVEPKIPVSLKSSSFILVRSMMRGGERYFWGTAGVIPVMLSILEAAFVVTREPH